jgi:RecB family exonuclease
MGSALHEAIQYQLECHLAADPILVVEPLMAVFRQRWKTEVNGLPVQYAKGDTADTLAQTAEQMLQAYLGSSESKPTGTTLGVEEAIRFRLHEQLPDVLAKIDHLSINDGHLLVTDFKTTRSMWSDSTADDRADQLHLYGAAVESLAAELHLPVRLRFVLLTKAKTPKVESIEIDVDPSRVARSTRVFLNVFQAIQTGITYPSPSPMNCSGCPHQHRCDNWHREVIP